jgi:hypothetical protein
LTLLKEKGVRDQAVLLAAPHINAAGGCRVAGLKALEPTCSMCRLEARPIRASIELLEEPPLMMRGVRSSFSTLILPMCKPPLLPVLRSPSWGIGLLDGPPRVFSLTGEPWAHGRPTSALSARASSPLPSEATPLGQGLIHDHHYLFIDHIRMDQPVLVEILDFLRN